MPGVVILSMSLCFSCPDIRPPNPRQNPQDNGGQGRPRQDIMNAKSSHFCWGFGCRWTLAELVLAEGVGFEPTIRFPVYTLSKRAPSATRPSLRATLPFRRTGGRGARQYMK